MELAAADMAAVLETVAPGPAVPSAATATATAMATSPALPIKIKAYNCRDFCIVKISLSQL
jgi:hypothetical protein